MKGGLSGRKMTFEELVNRWRYAQKEGGTAGEALIRTFEAIRKEWNCDRHLVREGLAQVCGEKPNRDMALRALVAWDERGEETTPPGSANRRSRSQTPKPVARKENTEVKTVAGCTGTSCPHRDADGNRCGKRCTAHVLDSGAPTCGCPRGHRWDALGPLGASGPKRASPSPSIASSTVPSTPRAPPGLAQTPARKEGLMP